MIARLVTLDRRPLSVIFFSAVALASAWVGTACAVGDGGDSAGLLAAAPEDDAAVATTPDKGGKSHSPPGAPVVMDAAVHSAPDASLPMDGATPHVHDASMPPAPPDAAVPLGACTGYVEPTANATCHSCGSRPCQHNGCYGGYYCELSLTKCVAKPAACP